MKLLCPIVIGLSLLGVIIGFLVSFLLRPIKGNYPVMIYHLPVCRSYQYVKMTSEDTYFMTEKDAIEAGFKKAKNCP